MSAYSDYVLSLSPALYWKLNTSTGATDSSGNARDGSGQGGITIGGHTATYAPVLGESQASTDFDGSNDYVTLGYAPFTGTGTIAGWAYRDVNTNFHILAGGINANAPLLFLWNGNNDVLWRMDQNVSDATSQATWTNAWPGTTQWVHWVLIFKEASDTAELYINGLSKGVVTGLTTNFNSPGNFALGNGNPGWAFDGKMEHVAVSAGSALTAEQIASSYDIGINGGHRGGALMSSTLRGGVHRG